MTDTSTNPNSAAVMALARQAVLALGAFAVGRGWVKAEDLDGIATILITVGTAAYGLWKTHQRQVKIKTAETIIGPIPKS